MSMGGPPDVPGGGAAPGDIDPGALRTANALSELSASASVVRTNIGLGTAAIADKVAAGAVGVLDATDPTTTNARTPNAHAASHVPGGTDDVIGIAQSVPVYASGLYYFPVPGDAIAPSSGVQNNGRFCAAPFWVPATTVFDRIGMEIAGASTEAARSVADMVTNGTTAISSATAAFVASDVGRMVTGTNIPVNTYIVSQTGTGAVLTKAATGSGSGGSLTISGPVYRLAIFNDDGTLYPSTVSLDVGLSGTANSGGAAQFASSGAIDGHTQAVQIITINKQLTRGVYWLAGCVQGVNASNPSVSNGFGYGFGMFGNSSAPTSGQAFTAYQDGSLSVGVPSPFRAKASSLIGGAGQVRARIFLRAA